MDPSLTRYAENLRRREAAESYATKYERIWHKRLSDRRERRVIAAALALAARPITSVLDMPCGAGRLTGELARLGAPITGCDYSEEQLAICAARHPEVSLARGDALALPFEDGAFDLAFSARLSHHIGDPADRERYLAELLRVARRAVIFTVFDEASLKNRLRELRRALGLSGKRGKFTMALPRIAELAGARGWRFAGAPAISWLASGHRYVVLNREPG